jgi:hypothetical protein
MSQKKKRPAQPASVLRPARASAFTETPLMDALNVVVLAGLAIWLASISWFKWPDPLIDFGRELYLPWRISQGAVLFKDDFHLYGPLSPYLNSLFFRVFGVGLSTLVAANVVIYSAILGLLYYLVRQGWGRWAAFTSCAFFVGVFSFSHLVGINNYNFLTPYSHELTHGILLLLCLIFFLRRAIRSLSAASVAMAGLLAGLSLLLKPEIIFAAAVAVAGAIFLAIRPSVRKAHGRRWVQAAGIFVAAGFVPSVLASLLLWLRGGLPLHDAVHYANFAWLTVFQGAREAQSLRSDPFQLSALGFDHPWQNLGIEILWGAAAIAVALGLAWGTSFFKRTGKVQRVILVVMVLAAAAGATRVPWLNVGYALPGILLCGAVIEILQMWKPAAGGEDTEKTAVRLLLWLVAAAMLARMALSPRIYHYGFAQAALAGIVGVAILTSSIPKWIRLEDTLHKWYQGMVTILVAGIAGVIVLSSMQFYSYHTLPVGEGDDQFYTFDQDTVPTGLLVEQARQYLEMDARQNNVHSLLVLPEGVMLNYLTRIPNSIPYYFFAPFVLAYGRMDDILLRLNATPPDRILVISRDMREFGVGRFGDSPEHGQKLIEYIVQNYEAINSFGYNDPLDPDRFGFVVFARKGTVH